MALFQKSVLNKYLKEQETPKIQEAYKAFTAYFHNPEIQENIRSSKEEQFQTGFLDALFVKIFDYTLNPTPEYNLTTEFKNLRGAKKVDGAILREGNAIGVIELKSTKTKDLESVRQQAFDYKANQPKCVYVITSNFEKLRFYINNAVDFEEFDLFTLTEERFTLLYLCLHSDNLLKDLPLTVKEASVTQEDKITKQLYKDYSQFKNELFNDLVTHNLDKPVLAGMEEKEAKLLLFKESQKLLDRFLFIFFAEDSGLLPPNSISMIIEQWEKLKDLDEHIPLYNRYKKYFGYLNDGYKGKKYEIFAYNGGLFLPDEVLDTIEISDELLHKHTVQLAKYDFGSEVDVNILGHIFENSLNEIEEVTAQLEGSEVDVKKGKRKKDGVFYTPKYITKYIVDNTLGKLCEEKKNKLEIEEEEYFRSRKGRKKETLKVLVDKLKTYREWLLALTICDPACGSGAFLNQALDFLINEHRYIDELNAKVLESSLVMSNISNQILENNIYGVDINEESVEIAKLSLWLRTAQKGRKLTVLNNNIKCGNSLIDDPEVAGDKAFKWQKQFPEIFEKGGFDVIIGNPPYGANLEKNEKEYLKIHYSITEYNYDTYNFFFELSIELLKEDSYLGFITPNTFLVVENGILLRKYLFKKNRLIELYETFKVFPDAVVEPITAIIQKSPSNSDDVFDVLLDARDKSRLGRLSFSHRDIYRKENLCFNYRETKEQKKVYLKIAEKSKPLVEYANVTTGIKPYQVGKGKPKQTKSDVQSKLFTSFEKAEGWYPLIRGTQVNRYLIKWDGEYIKYGEWLAEPRKPEIFFNPKLFIRRTDDNLMCSYDEQQFIGLNSIHSIQSFVDSIDNKYLLSIINSKLCNWYFRHENFHMVDKPMAEVKVVFVERLPIIISHNQEPFIDRVNILLKKKDTQLKSSSKLLKYLQSQFNIEVFSKKLQNWYELDFADFIKELNKAIKKAGGEKLTKKDEIEWMELFQEYQQEAQSLQTEIQQTEKEIDQLVYALYGLTEEEIAIVEGGV